MKRYKKIKNLSFQLIILSFFYLITLGIFFYVDESSVITGSNSIQDKPDINLIFVFLFLPILIRYYLNILISPFYPIIKKVIATKNRWPINYEPMVSVIIPAWNEEVGILSTIKSILNNTYRNFEIIVVNDGSTDDTKNRIENFLKDYAGNIKIKYYYQENSGKAAALNLGFLKSSGEIIITIDADSIMDKNTIKNFVACYLNPKIMSAAGNVKIGNNKTFISLLQTLEYIYGFYFKKADSLTNTIYIVGGAAASYRRSVFENLGLFDINTITEDIEMSTRIQNAGGKIAYAASAIVYTEGPTDIESLLKQRTRWKRGRFETFYKYRHLFLRSKEPNYFLTFFVLPLALFTEFLLLIEPILLILLYGYIFITKNFVSLIASIVIFAAVLSIQILTDEKHNKKYYLFLWAPHAWLIFYIIDFVEYNALIRSLWSLITKKEIKWQRWKRIGVYN